MFSVGRVCAIKPNDISLIEALLGIMNSKLSFFLMKSLCPIKQGGFFKISSQYLNSFPIAIDDKDILLKIKLIVDEIHFIINSSSKESIKELESQIDQLVYQLYDLTEEEIEIIENA